MKNKLHKLVMMFVASIFAVGAWAQTDVTNQYLKNAGFDDQTSWVTEGNVGNNNALAVADWTATTSGADWFYSAAFGYGSVATINNVAAPAVNPEGIAEGGALGISVGWGCTVQYKQDVKLPAGVYTLTYKVYNANPDAAQASNLFGFVSSSAAYYGKTTNFVSNTWVEESTTFVLAADTEGAISVGVGAMSGGSGANAKLFVDGVKLNYEGAEFVLEPGDVTDMFLTNADFSQKPEQNNGGAINTPPGWTLVHETSGWQDGIVNNEGQYNFWAGNIVSLDMYQKVVLPAGKYSISAEFFYDATDFDRVVYAAVGNDVVKSSPAVKDTWSTVSATFLVEEEGEVTLGISSKGWFKVDNVRLEYLGKVSNDDVLNAAKETFTAAYEEFGVAFTACQAMMIKTSYYEIDDAAYQLNEQLESITDVDALNAMVETLNEATASLIEINEVYAEYNVFVQKFQAAAEISEPKTAEAAELLEYNMYGGAGMQATSLEALEQAVQSIKEEYFTYIANANLLDGNMFNLTYLIQNPSFNSNMDGWTCVNAGHNGGAGYNNVGGLAEIALWGATSWEASISQTLENLPNGTYVVKAAWMAASGIEMTFSANEGNATVVGIGDQGGNIANDGSVVGMGQGFRGWQYVEVEGTVEDGVLTIAVNSSSSAQFQWSNADEFELYYAGAVTEETPGDDPTGIETVDADADVVIYDLSGRRVEKMTKGLYIVNGKKVVIK